MDHICGRSSQGAGEGEKKGQKGLRDWGALSIKRLQGKEERVEASRKESKREDNAKKDGKGGAPGKNPHGSPNRGGKTDYAGFPCAG